MRRIITTLWMWLVPILAFAADPLLASSHSAGGTTSAAPHQPSFIEGMLPFIVILVVFWFFIIRPQMKRTKEQRNMINALDKGDEVVTTGGVLGKITKMSESVIELSIADNVTIKVQKSAVTSTVPKGTV